MINELLLLSGNDIPFPAAQVNIHQPTLKEIAYISEETFFIGCELLRFSKNSLPSKDKNNLENQTDFDIIMSIMKDKKSVGSQRSAACAQLVLLLLFPDYQLQIRKDHMAFTKPVKKDFLEDGQKVTKTVIEEVTLNNRNYNAFKEILTSMFCLKKQVESEYNTVGAIGDKIADKLRAGRAKKAALQGKSGETEKSVSVYSRYISVLAVGLQKNINELMSYTVYQLHDEFDRYKLKSDFDATFQAKMAGAKDLKEVDNWMKDLHSESIEK